MPTERFYRLPEEKRRMIRDAAFKEFARVPIDKVSINQIIKEADISRGSFYTYFEDKWDVLGYIFEESQARIHDLCSVCLEESGGDIWYMLERVMDCLLETCSEKEKFDFIKNALSHASSDELVSSLSGSKQECDRLNDELMRHIFSHYDKGQLRPMEYREFFAFIQLAMFTIAVEVKSFFEGTPVEEIRRSFKLRMDILRRGVCPHKPGDIQQSSCLS